jgi:hypothetical protein
MQHVSVYTDIYRDCRAVYTVIPSLFPAPPLSLTSWRIKLGKNESHGIMGEAKTVNILEGTASRLDIHFICELEHQISSVPSLASSFLCSVGTGSSVPLRGKQRAGFRFQRFQVTLWTVNVPLCAKQKACLRKEISGDVWTVNAQILKLS